MCFRFIVNPRTQQEPASSLYATFSLSKLSYYILISVKLQQLVGRYMSDVI